MSKTALDELKKELTSTISNASKTTNGMISKLSADLEGMRSHLTSEVASTNESISKLQQEVAAIKADRGGLSAADRAKLNKSITLGSDGNLSNGFVNIGTLFATGLKQNDDPNSVSKEVDRLCLKAGLGYRLDGVEVFELGGKKVAKLFAAPVVCARLLKLWGGMFRKHLEAQRASAGGSAAPPPPLPPPTHINLGLDLTKAGQAERKRLKPVHARLKAAGLYPSWSNGVELLYRPDGTPGPGVPYVEETAAGAAGATGATGTAGATSTPVRPPPGKRPADGSGTNLRTGLTGDAGRSRTRVDGDVTDQGDSNMKDA